MSRKGAEAQVPALTVDHVTGSHAWPLMDIPSGTRLYTAPPSAPVGVIGDAIRHLSKWLDMNDCECESGHQCGRTEVEQTRDQLRALAQQPAAVAPVGADLDNWARHYSIGPAALEALRNLLTLAQQPSVAPVGVEGLAAAGIRRCGRCKRDGNSADCTRCGGTGWRRKCTDLDCHEHGCCGGHTCYVSPEEVAALAQQPAAVDGGKNRDAWRALWLVLRQTGAVAVTHHEIVSADWSRCQVEQTQPDMKGTVRLRATLLDAQPGGSDNDR